MSKQLTARISIAATAALIALATTSAFTPASAAGKEAPGRCYGINSCKGTSLCATATHDCKGLNNCKGEGVIVKTKSDCLAAGGTLTESKPK